nr:MAG TPA: hypothetical protein [Caudoviricetes sp.]
MSEKLINPITLLKRIQAAKRALPEIMRATMERRKKELINLNKENLMQGKDSEGNDMPPYRNPEYAHFKTSINPNNRGFWDLRVTGQYQNFVDVIIHPAVIFFKNDLQNEKAQWLHSKLGTSHLGVTEEQGYQFQLDNKPEIRKKILDIINNGV